MEKNLSEEIICEDQGCRISPIVQRGGGGFLEPTATYGVPIGRNTTGRRAPARRRRRAARSQTRRVVRRIQRGFGRRGRKRTSRNTKPKRGSKRRTRKRNGRASKNAFF